MNEQQYEKLLNINTSGNQYGFPKLAQYHRYEPTPYSGLEQLFEHYILPENACLVDIGCGKGRVPIYIHHQFQIPVVGIEMDQKFFVEAEHNREQYLKKFKRKGESIQFINKLAETYKIADKDNVFFFFNPFSIHVFRQVMNHIFDSIERKKRVVDVILYYPAPEYMLYLQQELALNFLIEIKLMNEKNENERIVVFRMP
ncbi:methyltransferase [Solibacillus sp. R5-41]|uniref:class I SAM-dependent methyltransferase n=1 Tax=Solibacillus sp. R5-41 TaxID=2048654 RepID=UPI000C126FAD|nr:class I SAM-dependent methyltransferase [Solibacillus sp. R5-41]ATP42259.1 methyltransferase [Solibacillus sp. R5-41]